MGSQLPAAEKKGEAAPTIKDFRGGGGTHSVARSSLKPFGGRSRPDNFLFQFGFSSDGHLRSKENSTEQKPTPMGLTQIHLMAAYSMAVVLVVALTYVSGDDIILQKKSDRNRLDVDRFLVDDRPRKRPFCNAFTGCGKKRSDESMATLVELNSEPAVEELNKQILFEAKLWEAIQEARAEVERQREERQNIISRSLPLALAKSNYRKKRAVRALEQKGANHLAAEQYGDR